VFALGDTFLEVVSPVRSDTAAGRLIERRGGDCGYMTMFQVDELAAARQRVEREGIRVVFEVTLDDIAEVHLHPSDMRGAIVSLSRPEPPGAWRWGGPEWDERRAPLRVAGATIAVTDPDTVARRWGTVLGAPAAAAGVRFAAEAADRGLVEVAIEGPSREAVEGSAREAVDIGGVRFVFV
jgi:hypothetical protein